MALLKNMEQISLFSLLPKTEKKFADFPSSFMYQDQLVVLQRKAYQRTIHLYVEAWGAVRVSCSRRTSLMEIKSFLKDHWSWIQKQLLHQKKIREKYPLKTFRSGESFLFRGKKRKLKYKNISSVKIFVCTKDNIPFFHIEKNHLIYYWRALEDLNRDLLKKELRTFYQEKGKVFLQEALSVFSSRMRLFPCSVRIGSQRSLWGSCSGAGRISLNWRLAVAPHEVLNYVVIHELAHLKHLNHSCAFWSLVARFCPEYRKYESWLRQNIYAMDFLLPRSELHG